MIGCRFSATTGRQPDHANWICRARTRVTAVAFEVQSSRFSVSIRQAEGWTLNADGLLASDTRPPAGGPLRNVRA
jgi:hypothetical protein